MCSYVFLPEDQRFHEISLVLVFLSILSPALGTVARKRREHLFTIHPLAIPSCNKYLFGTCFALGLVLGSEDTVMNQINMVPSAMGLPVYR